MRAADTEECFDARGRNVPFNVYVSRRSVVCSCAFVPFVISAADRVVQNTPSVSLSVCESFVKPGSLSLVSCSYVVVRTLPRIVRVCVRVFVCATMLAARYWLPNVFYDDVRNKNTGDI